MKTTNGTRGIVCILLIAVCVFTAVVPAFAGTSPWNAPKRELALCVNSAGARFALPSRISLSKDWTTISQSRFEAPMMFVGLTALSVLIKTKRFVPYFIAA